MGVKIEPACPWDRDTTIALWEAAGLTRPWNDPGTDFDNALANPTSDVLLAREGGDLLGSVMVGFDGHRGWVYYLAAAPTHRKRGIGRALMNAAEDWLRQLGCSRIRLMVRDDNPAAREFYEAVGFDVQGVITLGRTLD